jgi:hypothetical protein
MKPTKILKFTPLVALMLVGCSLASVVADVAKYLPTAEQAFAGVINILEVAGVLTVAQAAPAVADENKATSVFADLQTAIAGYEAAKASGTVPASKLQDVVNVLAQVETNEMQFETDLGFASTNKDVQTANAIIDLSVGTFDGFSAQLGVQPSNAIRTIKGDTIVYSNGLVLPRATSVADFKRKYNAIVKAGGHPEKEFKLSVAEKFHLTKN